MRPQFEWQVGKDREGQWETIARIDREPTWLRRLAGRVPPWITRWFWCAVLAVVVACTAGGYAWMQFRSRRALEQAKFQIQNVIDLEVRTFEEHDGERFLAQQDEQSLGWYAQQKVWFLLWPPPEPEMFSNTVHYQPILPAQVQAVDVQGEVARVEVLEEEGTMRRARFYRRTDLGWKHTAPRVEPWETPVHIQYENLDVRCHKGDLPHIAAALEHIARVIEQVCAELACPSDSRMRVEFALDRPTHQLPRIEKGTLILASPWLSGIPVAGEHKDTYLEELSYWTAFAAARQATDPQSEQIPNSLQEALLDEYAAWHAQRDIAQAPLLAYMIEQRGPGAVLEMLAVAASAQVRSSVTSSIVTTYTMVSDKTFSVMMTEYDATQFLPARPRRALGHTEIWLTVADEAIFQEQKDILLLLHQEANRLYAADPQASRLNIRSVRVLN
jgi:hypothetical protein